MKIHLSTLGLALGAVALMQTGIALGASPQSAEAPTSAHSSRIAHENLLREFSQGLGVGLADLSTAAP